MPLARFAPPAGLAELSPAGLESWSQRVSGLIDDGIRGGGHPSDSPRAQFFNPTMTELAADAAEQAIFWTASPRKLIFETSDQRRRWKLADESRDRQDEYCEWAVRRNTQGKIIRVTFSCEVPEYFSALHDDNPQQLLALYRRLVSSNVQLAQLRRDDGSYNPRNQWNVRTDVGPAHLIQATNNFEAAVELAAAATIVRRISGRTLTAEQELIACSRYGDDERNSDPHIGAALNALARQRADLTLADPAGLYISDFTPAGWTTKDGTNAKEFWRYTRGSPGRRLRGVYEVPAAKGYAVGDIKIRGKPIEFGAQIADFVSIKIIGLAHRFGKSTAAPKTTCRLG